VDLFCGGGGGWALWQSYWDCVLALAVGFFAAVANICDGGGMVLAAMYPAEALLAGCFVGNFLAGVA